ncbi:DUF4231 domain-containing protein [Eubacterium sp. MSJ-13]|uniref:DUF4231 domain-containing protein n=1 Tax=Eubacterium sp. MSJ-13 TaxID=2841513 RepID=UPI001C0F6ED6|nr:DUF4231 domain-containing protein [Eubacterium sp. MSJ-13]MBU5478005.1 DUF4231 domain-containing protein [Eubacterium sp. MSJ-13]
MEKNTGDIYNEIDVYLKDCDEEEKAYIANRLLSQILWYDNKAVIKQNKYKRFTIISIILTSCIPIVAVFTKGEYADLATVFIDALSVASSALLSIVNFCEYHKLWVEYREACEILKSNLYRYFMKIGEFDKLDKTEALKLLIVSCEDYMIKEFKNWKQIPHEKEKE